MDELIMERLRDILGVLNISVGNNNKIVLKAGDAYTGADTYNVLQVLEDTTFAILEDISVTSTTKLPLILTAGTTIYGKFTKATVSTGTVILYR